MGTCQSKMVKPWCAVALGIALLQWIVTVPAAAKSPVWIAVNRCNAQTVDDASRQLDEYDGRAPRGRTPQLMQRYGAIEDLRLVLNEERDILQSVCTDDPQRASLFAQIAASSALALSLESDIAAMLNASCPSTAKELPTMMLADAWLTLANVVNQSDGLSPGARFAQVTSKVQAKAVGLSLTLPPWSETSAYWRDQVRGVAKDAMKKGNCE